MKKIVYLLAGSVAFMGAPVVATTAATAGPAVPGRGVIIEQQSTQAVLAAGASGLDDDPEDEQADEPVPVSGAF
jgi:hypothetical protein